MLSVLKVHDIPFTISDKDNVLAENIDNKNLNDVLTDLGYSPKDTKTHVTESGTAIYYKNKKNGVYVKYIQEHKEIDLMFDFIYSQLAHNKLFKAVKKDKSIVVSYTNRTSGYTYDRTAFTVSVLEETEYTLKLDLDWDDFFNEDARIVDRFATHIAQKMKELDTYYSTFDVKEILTYAYCSSVPK